MLMFLVETSSEQNDSLARYHNIENLAPEKDGIGLFKKNSFLPTRRSSLFEWCLGLLLGNGSDDGYWLLRIKSVVQSPG